MSPQTGFRPGFFRQAFHLIYVVIAVAVTTGILFLLRDYLSSSVVALLYLVPIVISATLWGMFAGILASTLSFMAFNYFFILPYYTLLVGHPQDFIAVFVLLGVAIIVSTLMARARTRLQQVEERERETVFLYKLSADLTGKQDETEIARTLARHFQGFFGAAGVEIEVNRGDGNMMVRVPENAWEYGSLPAWKIPLSLSQGSGGEVRIWGIRHDLSNGEKRILQSFVNQGSLALDRALLATSETRARILEESDRLKSAILSSVSHELRTPLATIQAAATSLFESSADMEKNARDELQTLILEETDHMVQLVGNLLNMSRIEAKALKLQKQWNSLDEILDVAMKRLRRVATQNHIIVDVSDDMPLVFVDSVLMEQVFINLVGNSLKFGPPNSSVRISAEQGDRFIQVSVRNQGPPIPEEYIQHVFEKFYPIPGRDSTRSTGLGLSICKGIVEAHGGTIWANNLPDGVAFQFTLPLSTESTRLVLPQEEEEPS